MKFIRLILELLALYLLYKFVFDLLLPMIRSTKKMKEQVDAFQQKQQMHDEPAAKPNPSSRNDADYIDFEEIKSK